MMFKRQDPFICTALRARNKVAIAFYKRVPHYCLLAPGYLLTKNTAPSRIHTTHIGNTQQNGSK